MAAIGARTLALVFGAAYSGSYIYNNQERARAVVNAVSNAIIGTNKSSHHHSDHVQNSSTSSNDLTHLSHQVDRLAREVSRNRTDPVVIMGTSAYKSSLATLSDVFNLLGWAVVAVSLGGAVYYVAFRKRFRVSDLAWVSQTTFNGTIETMQNGISRVRDTVGAVRNDLSNRLGLLKNQVDGVQTSLSNQIQTEVGEVQKGVNDVNTEVAGVKDMINTVQSQIDDLGEKIDLTTGGVMALLHAVSVIAPQQVKGGAFEELRHLAKVSDKYAEMCGGLLPKRVSSTGLAGLLGGSKEEDSDNNRRTSLDMGSPSECTPKVHSPYSLT